MIDLSYLTEEEQEMIMKVLKRDSNLKKAEEDRVQKLQKTEKDGNKLKYMTGEWFYEAKSKRHRDKIHGSDIIRASMRRKKPVTLYELSQSRGEKPSWVNTVNKDVFLPPELEGLIEQPEEELPLESTLSNTVQAVADPQIDQPRQTSTSAGKERQNPFNDYSLADDMLTFPHEALPIENSLVLSETTPGELLSTRKGIVDSVRVSNTEMPVSSEERDAQVPVPKKRTIVPKQQDFVKENEKPLPRSQSKTDQNGNLPKGILKRSSSSSSNDSEILRNNSSIQGPNSNRGFLKSNSIKTQSSMEKTEEGSQNSLDRKQVRFSPTVRQKEFPEKTQISDGKELGEHGLLESELDRSQMFSSVTLEQDERKSEEISGLLQNNDFSQSNTFTNNQTWSHKNRQQENNEVTLPAVGATRENSQSTTDISQWIQSSNEYIDIPINGPHTKVLNTPGEENTDQHEFYAEPKSSQVSSPPSASADKGKTDNTWVQNRETSSKLEMQNSKLTKEADESISKVLEWFSRSTEMNSSLKASPHYIESDIHLHSISTEKNKVKDDCHEQFPSSLHNFEPTELYSVPQRRLENVEEESGIMEENVKENISLRTILPEINSSCRSLERDKVNNERPQVHSTSLRNLEFSASQGNLENLENEAVLMEKGVRESSREKDSISSRMNELQPVIAQTEATKENINVLDGPLVDSTSTIKKKNILTKLVEEGSSEKMDNLNYLFPGENNTPEVILEKVKVDNTNKVSMVDRESVEHDAMVYPMKAHQDNDGQFRKSNDGKMTVDKQVNSNLDPATCLKYNVIDSKAENSFVMKEKPVNTINKVTDVTDYVPEDDKEKNVHNPPAVHVKTEKYHLPVVEGSSKIATYDDDSILLKPGNDYESVYLSKYQTYEGLGEPDIHLQSNESHYPQDVGSLQYFNENHRIKTTVDSEEEKVEPEIFVIGVKQLPEDDLVKLDKKNDNSDNTEFNNIKTSSSLKSPGIHQTHNFKIQSMKERMQSGMKAPDSSNSQFQSLVMFWNTSPEKQKPVLKGELPSADIAYQSEDIENPGPTSSSMEVWEKGELLHQQQLLPKDGKKLMNPNIFPKVLPTDASDIHLKSFQSSPPKSSDIKEFSNEEVVEVMKRSTRIPSIDHETLNQGLEKLSSEATSGLSVEETQSKTPNAAPIVQRVSFVDRVKERSRQTVLHQPNETYEDKPVNELISNQMPIVKFTSPVEKKHEIDPMVNSSAEFTIRRPSVEEEYIIPARKKSDPISLQNLAQSLSEKEIISLSAETSERKMHEEDCLEDDRKTNSFARRTSVEEEYIIPEANKRDDISLHTLVQSLAEKKITFESSVTNEVEKVEKDLLKDQREINRCVKGSSVEEEVEYLIPKVKEYSASSHHSIVQPLTEEEFTSPSTGISEVEAQKDLLINDEKESDSCERRMSVVEEDIVPEQKKSDEVDLHSLAQSLAEKEFTYTMSSEVESRNAVFNESIKLWNSSDNYAENTPVIEDDILPETRNNDFESLYILAQSLSEVSALYPSNSAPSPQYNSDQSEDYTSLDPGKKITTEKRAFYKPEDYNDDMESTLNSLRASTPVKINKETSRESHEISLSGGPSKNLDDEDNEVPERRSLPDDSWSDTEQRRKSARFDEESNPIMMALRRSKNKPLASSKSLEDITAATSDERSFNNSRDDLVMSAEDDLQVESPQIPKDTISGFSTVPSSPVSMVSDPEKIKQMSKSVPAFLQQESDGRETDSTSESSFPVGRHKKTASSLTNLSSSSGMASLSSVSGSVMSVYSGDFGNVDVKGNIQFALDYVSKLKELHIFVVQCKDLAAAEPKKQRSDPYVKSYLLPDKAKMGKRKTSVKKKTLNPTFNEILRYKIDNDTLKTQTLNLSVWHNDTFGRNSFLGEVDVDLASWNWDDKQMNWFPLRPRTPSASQGLTYRGEMKVALRFDPQPSHGKKTSSTGEVYIWVKDCKNLPMLRSSGINSFVKCSVLPDTSRKSRQKTRIVKKSANPLFNHTMVYDGFRPDDLKEACVELTVWDHDKLVNHFLGGLRLGLGTGKSYGTAVDWMDSSADEATLWERMIDTPNEWVEDVLPLRMLTMAKMSGK